MRYGVWFWGSLVLGATLSFVGHLEFPARPHALLAQQQAKPSDPSIRWEFDTGG
jgi:hypothetical protein